MGDLSVCRLVLNPLSHTSQGSSFLQKYFIFFIEREREKEGGGERERFVVPLIYAFIG